MESRVAKQTATTISTWTSPNPNIGPSLSAFTADAELQTSNIKLRRQLESVRKELHSANLLLERERVETAKRRLNSSSPRGRERNTSRSNSAEVRGNNQTISELKKRVVDLERQLKLERYGRGRLDNLDQRNHRSPPIFQTVPSSQVKGLTRRSLSADTSITRLSKHTYQKPPRYATPTLTGRLLLVASSQMNFAI